MNESAPLLPTSFAEPLQRFYEFLRSEKGLSLHTQRNYKQQLETMAQYLISVGVKDWRQVDAAWVRQLASKGMRSGMKESSLATRLSSLRSFFFFPSTPVFVFLFVLLSLMPFPLFLLSSPFLSPIF